MLYLILFFAVLIFLGLSYSFVYLDKSLPHLVTFFETHYQSKKFKAGIFALTPFFLVMFFFVSGFVYSFDLNFIDSSLMKPQTFGQDHPLI